MKKLPTGIQEFEHIRCESGIYVDKTDMIYNIVSDIKKQFFLARPRRFGKTLLCWTLNALFSGKRELFEGLAISKTDWAWESYPVIHLNMSKVGTSEGVDGIKTSLISQTENIAEEHGIDISDKKLPGDMLEKIIVGTSKKHSKPVVVIVDEYDNPFSGFFHNPEMAEKIREIMSDYYVQLKANEPYMRFLFMTGISKFSKVGVFSKLNNLNDLSLDEEFGTLLGYTQEELTAYFDEHLQAIATKRSVSIGELINEVRDYYNGFCFDGVHKVYNPFSTLSFLQKNKFLNYWVDSGSSKFMTEYMRDRHLTVEQFRGMPVSLDFAFSPGDIDTSPPETFLFQSGYLTLREGVTDDFALDYPNTEVLKSMSKFVAQNIIRHGGGDYMNLRVPLLRALAVGDSEELIETLNRLLVSIPYDDYVNAAKQGLLLFGQKITTQEWLYRSTILAFLRGCDVLAFGEMHNNQGRSDLLLIHRNVPWIIEIKVTHNNDNAAVAQEAMKQIKDRQYDGPYTNAKRLAIAIDDEKRQIGEWIVE